MVIHYWWHVDRPADIARNAWKLEPTNRFVTKNLARDAARSCGTMSIQVKPTRQFPFVTMAAPSHAVVWGVRYDSNSLGTCFQASCSFRQLRYQACLY
jgi:hypothetical protein